MYREFTMSASSRRSRPSGTRSLELSSETGSVKASENSAQKVAKAIGDYCTNTLKNLRETESFVKTLQQQGENISKLNDDKQVLDSAKGVYGTIAETQKMLDNTKLDTTQLRFKVDEITSKLESKTYQVPGKRNDYKVSYISNIDISVENDKYNAYHVYGIASLPDGRVILADFWNKCLKLTDSSQNVKKVCDCKGQPWGLCNIDNKNQFAVSMTDKQTISIVNFDGKSASIIKEISIGQPCRGICYHSEKFYVACAGFNDEGQGQLQIVTKDGNSRVIQSNNSGKPIFSRPRHVYVDSSKEEIFVCDADVVKVLDSNGREIRELSHTSLKSPFGVCPDGNGGVLVSGLLSHNVVRFKDDQIGEAEVMVGSSDQINNPVSLYLHPKTDMLFVGMERNKNLKLFQVDK